MWGAVLLRQGNYISLYIYIGFTYTRSDAGIQGVPLQTFKISDNLILALYSLVIIESKIIICSRIPRSSIEETLKQRQKNLS